MADKIYANDPDFTEKPAIKNDDRILVRDSEASGATKYFKISAIWNWLKTVFAVKEFPAKGTLEDNDGILIANSASSNETNYSLFSTLKSTLKTYFDTLYAGSSQLPKNIAGNGVKSGFVISINSDNTKIDISAGKGYIVNNYADAENPVLTTINFSGSTALVLTYLATSNITYLAIDSLNNVIQSISPFTPSQRRQYLLIGAAIHSNFTNVNAVNNFPDVFIDQIAQFNDLCDAIKPFNIDGNVFSPDGANLSINKSEGYIFKKGSNFQTDNKNPHKKYLAQLLSPATITYRLSNSTEYPATANIDPNYYESGGNRIAVDNNKFTAQPVCIFETNLPRIQYGQKQYATMEDAINGIKSDTFVFESNISKNGILRAWLIVKQGTTNLNTATDAKFIETDKWGNVTGSSGNFYPFATQAEAELIATEETPENLSNTANMTPRSVRWFWNKFLSVLPTKEYTGFDITSMTRTYNSTNRTITLTGTFTAYFRGRKITALTSGWVSDPHPVTLDKVYFLYYNGTSFVWSETVWTFDMCMIAFVNYGTNDKFAQNETHGLMQWQNHKELHETIGTYLSSGGDLGSYVLNSTIAGTRRPTISATVVQDEDLPTSLLTLNNDSFTQFYLSGSGTVNFAKAQAEIIPVSGNQPFYNQNNAGTWQQTLITNNSYAALFLVAAPVTDDSGSQYYRYFFIQPQQISGTLSDIQAVTPNNLTLGNLTSQFTEYVFIGKIIIRYTSGNWTLTEVSKLTGTKIQQASAPVSGFLSSVTADSSFTGAGTAGNPLKLSGSFTPVLDSNTSFVIKNAAGTNILEVDSSRKGVRFVTGTGDNTDVVNLTDGSIFFCNGNSGVKMPTIYGKSTEYAGLFIAAATPNNNPGSDMFFSVRETDNTDFADLTKVAFTFKRFGSDLLTIYRNGNITSYANMQSDTFVATNGVLTAAYSKNSMEFNNTSPSYIDQKGVGGKIIVRMSKSTAQDTIRLTLTPDGAAFGTDTPITNLDIVSASGTSARIHSNTDTSPISSLELVRGATTTFGIGVNTDYRFRADSDNNLYIQSGTSGVTVNNFGIKANADILTTKGAYTYSNLSYTADTIGDWRKINDTGILKYQCCTLGNATKGAGTWVDRMVIDASNGSIGINGAASSSSIFSATARTQTVSSNTTNYLIAGYFVNNTYDISAGVTDSGYRIGSRINTLSSSSSFLGTLTEQMGIHIQHGHYTGSGTGTITTSYGLRIESIETGSSIITNKWAIYQTGANFNNYMQGSLYLGTTSGTAKLDINSDILRLRTAKTPASAGAAGNQGDFCWDSNYLYICTATNTWKRVAVATW